MEGPEVELAPEAAAARRTTERKIKIAAASVGLISELLALAYVADIVTGGKVSAAVEPHVRRARLALQRTMAPYTTRATLAARHLVWDATEAVWDADPEWYRRAVA